MLYATWKQLKQDNDLYLKAWNSQESIADIMGEPRKTIADIINNGEKASSGDFAKTFEPFIEDHITETKRGKPEMILFCDLECRKHQQNLFLVPQNYGLFIGILIVQQKKLDIVLIICKCGLSQNYKRRSHRYVAFLFMQIQNKSGGWCRYRKRPEALL